MSLCLSVSVEIPARATTPPPHPVPPQPHPSSSRAARKTPPPPTTPPSSHTPRPRLPLSTFTVQFYKGGQRRAAQFKTQWPDQALIVGRYFTCRVRDPNTAGPQLPEPLSPSPPGFCRAQHIKKKKATRVEEGGVVRWWGDGVVGWWVVMFICEGRGGYNRPGPSYPGRSGRC